MIHLAYTWPFWARDDQLPPAGNWRQWAIIAGRGAGKTRSGAEWIHTVIKNRKRGAIVADTAADGRDVVVDGGSGIVATAPPWFRPLYEPSKRRITWPNGHYVTIYSGDKPDQLRGGNFEFAWIDEFAKMRYAEDVWAQLKYCMRIGKNPQVLITTTPRPIPILKSILADKRTVQTTCSTFANAGNLSPEFLQEMIDTFANTTLGQQELYAAMLDEAKGALWKRSQIDMLRVGAYSLSEAEGALHVLRHAPTTYREVVVGVDPATTSNRKSAQTGIIAVGKGYDGHGYVLADASGRWQPLEWAKKAVDLAKELEATEIVAEGNQGGDMVRQTIHTVDGSIPVRTVHARHSKQARAEPIASLYEQGRFHHVGMFAMLEDQMVTWEPESGQESPDRIDALVWAARRLFVSSKKKPKVAAAPMVIEAHGE